MTLSDTQIFHSTTSRAAPDGLVVPPAHLPPGPRASIARALLNAGLVARAEPSDGDASWKLDGEVIWLSITDDGRRAIGRGQRGPRPCSRTWNAVANTRRCRCGRPACLLEARVDSPRPNLGPSCGKPRPRCSRAGMTRPNVSHWRTPLLLSGRPGPTPPAGERITRATAGHQAGGRPRPSPPPRGCHHRTRNGGDRLGPAHRPRLLRRPEEEGTHRRGAGPRPPEWTRQRRRQRQLQHLPLGEAG